MAPADGPPRGRKPGAGRQGNRPIVPALPLPYARRQAAVAAATAPSRPEASPPASGNPPAASAPNGASPELPLAASSQQSAPFMSQSAASSSSDRLLSGGPALAELHSSASTSTASQNTNVGEPMAATPLARAAAFATRTPTAHHLRPAPRSGNSQSSSETPPADILGGPTTNGLTQQIAGTPRDDRLSYHHPPPSLPPSRYELPPSAQPPRSVPGTMSNGNTNQATPPSVSNGQVHRAQPSNGSVRFGAFHHSPIQSPAPPRADGRIATPPSMTVTHRPQGYVHPSTSGDALLNSMSYTPEAILAPTIDGYAVQTPGLVYQPPSGNLPAAMPYEFPDSQPSSDPGHRISYAQYPAGPGGQSHAEFYGPSRSHRFPNTAFNGFWARNVDGHRQPLHADDDWAVWALAQHMRKMRGDQELVDCALELVYPDGRARGIHIPGHRIIFSASPAVLDRLRDQSNRICAGESSRTVVTLQSNSEWIRSDSFFVAAQTLYGLPDPRIPQRHEVAALMAHQEGLVRARVDWALSYAAAGELLKLQAVVYRGCEMAAVHIFSSVMLEKAVGFALEEYRDHGVYEGYKYLGGSRILLNAAISFIARNLLPTFMVDTAAAEPEVYARLPSHTVPSPTPTRQSSGPTIARGTSVQLGRNGRQRSRVRIQFGDLTLSDDAQEAEQPAKGLDAHSRAVMSRVLLNVPFSTLKTLLEPDESTDTQGWADLATRCSLLEQVIKERETRRLHALQAVMDDRVPDSRAVKADLRKIQPGFIHGGWTALGWRETITLDSREDSYSPAAMIREWVPLKEVETGTGSEYP